MKSNALKSSSTKTREDYIKRSEHSGELDRVTEHLIRLETKLDRLSEKITYGKAQ
jgi:hypothetical protein